MAWIEAENVVGGVNIINRSCGCGPTTPLGWINLYDSTIGYNSGQQIQQLQIPREVPYTQLVTGLIIGRVYGVALFAWQGASVDFVEFVYNPLLPCRELICDIIMR